MTNWNLNIIYKDIDAWAADFNIFKDLTNKILDFKGKLTTKEELASYFKFENNLKVLINKLYHYVMMNFHKNQKDLKYQSLVQEITLAAAKLDQNASFISNELLKVPYEKYEEYAKEEKIINDNLFIVKKLFDTKEHILSPNEEKIISNFSTVSSAYGDLYTSIISGDFIPVEVELSTGEKVSISPNTYTSILSQTDSQEDRKLIFEAMFGYYEKHKNTLGQIYNGVINANIANTISKGYDDVLSYYLDSNKIPNSVYKSLIDTARNNTAPLKRFINIRKKYFNLDEYHTYDRFLTIAKNTNVKYDYETSYNELLKALEPMGEDFVNKAKTALKDGHVDVYPTDGKRSGAYSTNIDEFGPFILLNHNDDLESAFTLAHECGHSIHTLYANESQPTPLKDYTIFVAEIASTFNEHLFLNYLLKNSNNKELKIQALEKQINNIVATFYRQTLFADFEYQANQKVMNGEPITYEVLNNIMKDLYMTYYGIDLDTEPLKKMVWAYIPHLYFSPFYVYQYATCFSASMQLFDDIIINNKKGSKEKYINMLQAGGSTYPVDIVKLGGVDLTSKEPFEAVCKEFDHLLDELEELIK